MALRDVTREGVEQAMAEFDRLGRDDFLAEHGFRKARGYFLVRDGERYDSKAIAGVAHGYDRPNDGPLKADEFSGGDATVAPLLRALGFEVEGPAPRNPPWAEEELVLALDLYLSGGTPDKKDPGVIELSGVLRALTIHAERPDPERFRNANGVAMKLGNFAALDPNYTGSGMTQYGKRDAGVWEHYASDEDALAEAAAAIREGAQQQQPAEPAAPRVGETAVETQRVERFPVAARRQVVEAERREQRLVLAFQDHLVEAQGHAVTKHLYWLPGSTSPLACDLVDKTDGVLYEAKGDIKRTSVRMAIGQLLDYRRFEPATMGLAVLLPRKPPPDLVKLIRSVPAAAVWRTRDGFERAEP